MNITLSLGDFLMIAAIIVIFARGPFLNLSLIHI